jgi:hypothetical protein
MNSRPFNLASRLRRFIPIVIGLALLTPLAHAFDVTIEWDANQESNIAGYTVYVGLESRNYATSIDAGPATQQIVQSLTTGHAYYFAVTAYDTDGLESEFSEEVSYTPNETTTATPLTNVTVYAGQPASFSTIVAGLGPFVFAWRKNGTIINGAASAGLTLPSVGATDAGIYTVEISGTRNSVTNAALLTVLMIDTNTLPVPLQITFSNAASPVAVSFLSVAGRQYSVQASVDLLTWQTIYTVTSLTNGPNQWLDAEAPNFPKRFYRVISSLP